MKIKLAAILVIATSLFAAVGIAQASCHNLKPGWHMVSKKCPIGPAENWQQYTSGVYTQPMTHKGLFR